MSSVIPSASFGLLLTLPSSPLSATVIDFETQAANRGGNLTGIPDSPLTIGIATFTGGELRNALINLPADETGIYVSEGLFGSGETNPLVITFAMPVSNFSVLVANGDAQNQTYTVSDQLGGSASVTLALSGSLNNAAKTVALSDSNITTVSIASANVSFWNFAIDNVTFSAVPEPMSLSLVLVGLGVAFCCRRKGG